VQKPGPSSRHLHAGHHLGGKQVSPSTATAVQPLPVEDGYVVTDTGLQALTEAIPAEAPGTAAQVLRDAGLYLERYGWIQGAYYDATGLRDKPYGYSWSEIADRLGTSRQAAQMRYGDRTDRGALDYRLLEAGLNVSVATLVRVFADHHPGSPASSVCPGCGYRYPDNVSDCPTNATVRPLLLRRRGEDREAVTLLDPVQFEDLHKVTKSKVTRAAHRASAGRQTSPAYAAASLFDPAGKDVPR
jgi:hypothetical protein